jgi:hypothetical protein
MGTPVSSIIKTYYHDITEIVLKVALKPYILFLNGGYVFKRHFQQYFSYIVAVSFMGGKKPEYTTKTTDFSLTNFIT